MKVSFRVLPALLGATIGLPASAQDLVFTNESGTSVKLYGQISLTYQGVDDGQDTYDNFVDNNNSGSRVGMWIDMPMGENKLRFNLETSLGLRNTAEASQTDDVNWIDWQRTDIRKVEATYSGRFGAIWFGQGSMATDGVAEIDSSGTSLAGYVSLPDAAGAFEFRDGADLSGISIGKAFSDFDGSRRFRIRYDTPEYSGFSFSAAYGQEILAENDNADYYDAAIRYGIDGDTIAFDGGLGYAWKEDDDSTQQAIASASLLHVPSGFNVTLAAGDRVGDDGNYGYAKLGWLGDIASYGSTAVSIDYYDGSDFVTRGSESTSWGVQAVQTFDKANFELLASYRIYSYDDDSNADYEDLAVLLVGGRWKF